MAKMSYVDHIFFHIESFRRYNVGGNAQTQQSGNFDEKKKRRKFGDPLVYCPAAFFFFFFFFFFRYHNDRFPTFFSALGPYKHSCLLVSNRQRCKSN